MSPGLINAEDPIEKAKWQAAYKEGFEAGKLRAIDEMARMLARIKAAEAFPTYTATSETLHT